MKKLPVTKSGYSCPYCNMICSEKTLLERSEPTQGQEGDWNWIEKHQCNRCGKRYLIPNGT